MTRCRSVFKLLAIILLAAVPGLFILYPREGGELHSASQSPADQSTNRTTSRIQKNSIHQQTSSKQLLLGTFYSNRSLSEVVQKDAFSLEDGHQRNVLKQATNETLSVLTSQSIQDVEKFVFFIGYSRSGHSIIASIIDAHPNVVLAHEFDIFGRLATGNESLLNKSHLFNALYQDSYTEAITGWRSGNNNFQRKGYSLKLNSTESWQGKFRTLKVIGDKAGGHTSHVFRSQPTVFRCIYHLLVNTIHVPVRVIHVVRNPFDIIATRLLYRYSKVRGQKAQFNSTNKLKGVSYMNNVFNALSSEVKAVHAMIKICDLTVLTIHNEDFIRNPAKEVKKVCKFLGLNCTESYLKMCEQAAYKNISRTRDAVEWSQQMKRFVKTRILPFQSFKKYSFTGS